MVEKPNQEYTSKETLLLVINRLKEIGASVIDEKEIELLVEIGRGGFGVVYKAKYGDNIVAVKELLVNIKNDSIDEITNEILVIQRAEHEKLPQFYGVAISLTSKLMLVFEFIDGENYKTIYKQMDFISNISAMIQLCEIIHAMHEKRLIHRDIKPANTMIQSGNVVRVIDFGISKIASKTCTYTRSTVGTVYYMGPENYDVDLEDESKIEKPIALTPKADVWSIGCMISEIFSGGVMPWTGKFKIPQQIETLLIRKTKLNIPKIITDERVIEVINMCTVIDPQDRADMTEVIGKLQEIYNNEK